MSRSGYSDDHDQWDLIRWRGAVASALRGARGQAFLHELIDALDALPVHELYPDSLMNIPEEADSRPFVCALGAVGLARGCVEEMTAVDPEEREDVADLFGIAEAMAAEIMYQNDEAAFYVETPAQRWTRIRRWAESHLRPTPHRGAPGRRSVR